MTDTGQGEIEARIGKAEGSLGSINQTLRALLEQTKPSPPASAKEKEGSGVADAKKQDAEAQELLEETGEEGAQEDQISESDLPDLEGEHNDPFPEHLESLCEERSKAAHRNRWSAPEIFAASPLPIPFDPKDHRIDLLKGERSKHELKELCNANAWLEMLISKTARVALAEDLSKSQLRSCAKELRIQIGAICDASMRRAGCLLNQESRGRRAARVICEASSRARAQLSSCAEEQALPIIRGELLRADIKALAC